MNYPLFLDKNPPRNIFSYRKIKYLVLLKNIQDDKTYILIKKDDF